MSSVNLATNYVGLPLKNPLVVSSCPLTGRLDTLRELELAGAAAVVLPSLFEETIEGQESKAAALYDYQSNAGKKAKSYLADLQRYNVGPEHYVEQLREAKQALDIPVIASLNGSSPGGWTRYAKILEEAGADALELNIFFVPTDASVSPQAIEQRYVDLVRTVRETIDIPLSLKIGPFFSNIAYTVHQLAQAGADGVVLFNRYLAPDIDIDHLHVEPKLLLSSRDELWLSLRWIAIVYDQMHLSIAASSGVHFTEDIIKAILAGADATMMAAALITRGPEYITTLLDELEHWLANNQYESIQQLKGSMSRANCPDASAWERANYTKALVSFRESQ